MAPAPCHFARVIAQGTLLQFPASNHISREVKRLQKVRAKVIDGSRLIGYEPLPFPFDAVTGLSRHFFRYYTNPDL